jgi:site-specific DNA-methyltransferase (adenine-specific)
MNLRKLAYVNGFEQVKRRARVSRRSSTVGSIRPSLYNAAGMLEPNQIIPGDCIKELNDAPEAWVDLVFADPPFNIGYLYSGYNDERKTEDYLKFSEDWMTAVHRALKPSGSFYLAIGDEYAADLCSIARRKIGFHMRNWIIWHYTFGQQTKKMFAKSHTHILYFTKSPDPKDFTFNADAIRVASARQTTYADARANPKGKVPDDTWYLRPQETPDEFFGAESDTWNVSRVCGTFKEREGWHGCQMPIAVLDRKYVGIDQSKEYVEFARKRLQHALEAKEKKGKDAAITDTTRASRILTPTDAFGRKRVARKRAGRSANGKTVLTKTA